MKLFLNNRGFFVTVVAVILFLAAINVMADTTSTLRPTSDGGEDSANWDTSGGSACNTTNCYTEVDEASGSSCTNSDGDTSYIESNTNGASQTFDIDLSGITDGSTITQIDITTCNRRTQGGAKFQTRRCVNGTCTSSGSDITPGNTYAENSQSHTGLSISKDGSTDIEIGVINSAAKGVRVSQVSAVITYTPPGDTIAPEDVDDLDSSTVAETSVTLTWTAPGDDGATGTATSYDIRYSTSEINDGNWGSATQVTGEPSPSVAGSNESKEVTGLTASTLYYFAIKSSDEVPNESGLSNVYSTTTLATPDTTAPGAVTDLSSSGTSDTTVTLTWTSPGDDGDTGTATSYDIRYSTSEINDGNWGSATQVTGEPSPAVASSSESMNVTGLTASTLYYFAIKTSDEVPNESALSNVYSTTTDATPDTTAPGAVTDLDSSTVAATSVTLTWTSPGDDGDSGTASSYDIRYSTSNINDGNWGSATQVTGEPSPAVASSSESMNVTGLTANTLYYFGIKTSDEVPNESALSNIYSTTTVAAGDTTAPDAVTDLEVTTVASTAITLEWTAPGDDGGSGTADSYDIRYSTSNINDGNWGSATQVTGEPSPSAAGVADSMNVTGLTAETLYYFGIKTSDEVPNESDLSNIVSSTTLAASGDTTAPDAVTDLEVIGVGNSSATLRWTAPGDDGAMGTASSYDIRYSTSEITALNFDSATAATGEPSPSIAGSTENHTVTGLSEDTKYYFAIKTSDEVPNVSGISNVPSRNTAGELATVSFEGSSNPRTAEFTGYVYPGATVEVLSKDTIVGSYVPAPNTSVSFGEGNTFAVFVHKLIGARFFYALQFRDSNGDKTSLLSFDVDMNRTEQFKTNGIYVPPTIRLSEPVVKKGDEVTVSGYAFPDSDVFVWKGKESVAEAKAGSDGAYSTTIDSTELPEGKIGLRATYALPEVDESSNSPLIFLTVSMLPFPRADLNDDNIIDIIDWSTFLYRWGDDGKDLKDTIDINNDGETDIVDLSIFLMSMRR